MLLGNNWALVDGRELLSSISTISLTASQVVFMINFANGVPTQEERFQIENSLAAKFTGAEQCRKIYFDVLRR